jgi:hypothetical protein
VDHVTKNNIGPVFPDRVAWAAMSRTPAGSRSKAAPMMVPHIVSRTIYAGRGLPVGRLGGNGFELSQRARHIVQVTGHETTSNRRSLNALRKAADFARAGWFRVHLITKDSAAVAVRDLPHVRDDGLLFLWSTRGAGAKGWRWQSRSRRCRPSHSIPPSRPCPPARRLAVDSPEIQESYLAECEKRFGKDGSRLDA